MLTTELTTTFFMTVKRLAHSGFLYIRSAFPSESKYSVFHNLLLGLKKGIHPEMFHFSIPGNCINDRMWSPTSRILVNRTPIFLPPVDISFAGGITEHHWPHLTRWSSSRKLPGRRAWLQVRSEELREGWVGEKLTRKL